MMRNHPRSTRSGGPRRRSRLASLALVVPLLLAAVSGVAEEKAMRPSIPADWQFRLPDGDAEAGKAAFLKMQCYSCHKVPGSDLPEARTSGGVGPDLVAEYGRLPREFLAESIITSHSYISGRLEKYVGLDKVSSRMGDYSSIMNVRELIDITEYLRGLGGASETRSSP
jgi:hypothetical protein